MTDTEVEPDDETYIALPNDSSRFRKVMWALGGVAAVAALAVLLGGFWVLRQVNPGGKGAEVTVNVPMGSTTSQIARILEDEKVVTNATVFQYYTRLKGAKPFKAGRYDGLHERSAMGDVLTRLEAGPLPPPVTSLSVPEGTWLQDISANILATFPEMDELELFAALSTVRSAYQPKGSTNLEGLLFPATYGVEEGDELDEQKLVRQMTEKFDAVGDEIGLADAATRLRGVAGDREITPYDVIIVASMIQAEAGVPSDRAKIARVIYNRLADGESLGIDATVLFALGEHKPELTMTDLAFDSPYNTRLHPGLPPGPIGAPSREALEAALNPAEGNWKFYVLTDVSGEHFFTDSYSEHLAASQDAKDRGVF